VRITADNLDIETCGPVSHRLVPGYSVEAAAASPRRDYARGLIEEMIENNVLDAYHVGGVRRDRACSAHSMR
jgi:hypothetical protein